MRILSCHIVGFGKLVNKKIELNDLTVIRQDNGWGKTTFADFIRCMFYGLDGGRRREIAENDRVRYRPWSGAAFGGSLTFSYGGRTYRVERTFGSVPSQDYARVLDENGALCYAFGERAERLGETLFGLDQESYRRCVYVPQGEVETGGLPEGVKGRLLALLSANGTGAAKGAMERLDNADRALRAKRKPGHGKLDDIDARLDEIVGLRADKRVHAEHGKTLRAEERDIQTQILKKEEEIKSLRARIDRAKQRETYETNRTVFAEMRLQYENATKEIERIQSEFNGNDPKTVNTDGLQTAVDEYCRLQAEERRVAVGSESGEQTELLGKIEDAKRRLQTYQDELEKLEKEGAGTRRIKKGKKIYPPKRKSTKWFILFGLVLALVGAVLLETNWKIGVPLLSVGGVGLLLAFFRCLPRRERTENKADLQAVGERARLEAQIEGVQTELSGYDERLRALGVPPQTETNEDNALRRERMAALRSGIEKFLANFRLGEVYDYRAATERLKRDAADYARHEQTVADYGEKVRAMQALEGNIDPDEPVEDGDALQTALHAAQKEKDRLVEKRASTHTQAENEEKLGDDGLLLGEEERLREEKARLEKRHRAILAAKTILQQAQENLATRYLDVVERGCKQYLRAFSDTLAPTKFAADGSVRLDDGGILRETAYYSVGSKELVGFCTRLALADALFEKEKPLLVLDDPFVNLDDQKTERGKQLVKALSSRYQIVYLTCKTERAF